MNVVFFEVYLLPNVQAVSLKLSSMLVVNYFRESAILRIITLLSTRKLDTRSLYFIRYIRCKR